MLLDSAKIQRSSVDTRKNVTLPIELSEDLAEEVGMHIGDGSMNNYKGRFLYSLRGHRLDDEEYYRKFVAPLFKRLYNLDVNIRTWPDVIGFQIGSTTLCKFKHEVIGLPLGPKSAIRIPETVLSDSKLVWACVRGIFDTDGSLNFEKKRSDPHYPRIEISTTSEALFEQLKTLIGSEFKLSSWKRVYTRPNWKPLYKIRLSGHNNLNRWFKLVGSNNPKNIAKYQAAVAQTALDSSKQEEQVERMSSP